MLKGLFVEEVALLRLSAGITYHTGRSAYKRQRLMAATLKVAKNHDTAQMPNVKGVCGRIKAHISCHLFLAQEFIGSGHHLVDHASPSQFFNKIRHCYDFRFSQKSANIQFFAQKDNRPVSFKDNQSPADRNFRALFIIMLLIVSID